MVEYETDFKGNHLVREEELNLIYEGPSFEGRMEISNLTSQLRSTEVMIREIISELYRQKGLKNPKEVKIYLKLKKGSFHEIISVLFNNPTTAHIIGGCVVALVTYFLTKKKDGKECKINIESLINNYVLAKNFNQIIKPLEENKDNLSIISSDSDIKISIKQIDKKKISKSIRELKERIAIQIYEEDFFGYLSIVNIDKEKYGFTLEGTNQHIPITFDIKPSLDEIRKILGYRIKIIARAIYEEGDLKKLEVIDYKLKRRKNLKDFTENK